MAAIMARFPEVAKQSGQFCGAATGTERSLKNIKTEVFFGGGRSARAIGQTDQTPEKSRSNRFSSLSSRAEGISGGVGAAMVFGFEMNLNAGRPHAGVVPQRTRVAVGCECSGGRGLAAVR